MNKFFSSNLFMKILSVIFAVFLWFVALNSQNPVNSKTINVTLIQENVSMLSQNMLGMHETAIPGYVSVTVRGREEELEKISADDFRATIDFSVINKSGIFYLPVSIDNKSNSVYVTNISHRAIKINVKDIIKKSFPIQIAEEGTIRDGYYITKIYLSPDIIEIEGLEPNINNINSVVVPVHYEDLVENISTLTVCHFYDAQGKEITEYIGNYNVTANIEVAKEVYITPVIFGEPDRYHIVTDKKTDPEKILVQGSSAVLEGLDELSTVPVDIGGINESFNKPVNLQLPEGVSLYEPDKEIILAVSVDRLPETVYSITKERIRIVNKNEDYIYEIMTPNTVIKLVGISQDETINEEFIIPSINVGGLEVGIHEVPIKILVPNNIFVDGEYVVNVEVVEKPEIAGTTEPADPELEDSEATNIVVQGDE